MRRKIRLVLDTNIIISALFWSGFPAAILRKCMEGQADLILSREILQELKEVLRKEKKFGMTERKILEREKLLISIARIVAPTAKLSVVKKDEKDNKILECGIAGKANFIVSGDKHLLNLKEYGGIRIVTAREMVMLLEGYSSHL